MVFGLGGSKSELARLKQTFEALRERSELLDSFCGVGLWEAVLHNGDAMHPKSVWTWSAEFRRLLGYERESECPNVVQSWSDRLHPDDVQPTFAAFGGHLADKTGRSRYDVVYRLKVRDGSYRWFRATGGCRHSADGQTIRACGSLTDVHAQKTAELANIAEAETDKRNIVAIASGLASLANGDLTARIDTPISPKAQAIKDDFNNAMERLQETLAGIANGTAGMHTSTGDIGQAADDLARRTEQQAASLEETVASLDEITVTVRKTADGANHARDVVSKARADAEKSGEVVRQTVAAMNSIEKSSKQIGQIIGVIDEIAFQTNLLALNAGVEAARAGDAGRGFAVVASEVRGLAQRSAEAAKEIKSLISASTTQVDQGVDLIAETGKALERVIAQVAEINGIVAEIAASAQEQATGLQQVNTAVNEMDQVTQQNAGMVEQSRNAAHALASQAEELARMMSGFRLGRDGRPAPAVRAPHRPAAAAPTRTVMKTSGPRGGAARKPEPSAEARQWEEF